MNTSYKPINTLLVVIVLFIFSGCREKTKDNSDDKFVDYLTQTSGDLDFGKTDVSAYTPEIRENMKKLYEDKFGMFVHFGPYAQLEGMWNGEEVTAEWIMYKAKISIKDYEKEAAGKFKPEKFDAKNWVDIAENAGMKFIVVTAKHHDGFAMYHSKHPYNLVDFAGFGRDILKELSLECKARHMDLGFYYSQSQDWHEVGGFGNNWDFEERIKPQNQFDAYFKEKAMTQVDELTSNYGDIFMIWFDTPVQMEDAQCQLMMDVVKKNQPATLVNSRLGNGYGHFDVSLDNGKSPSVSTSAWLPDLKIPWQTHESVTEHGWGYTSYGGETNRTKNYTDFIYNLCRIVGSGGVYLLNVAPRPDGTIPESQVNSIQAIGDWLKINGESIYGADPSPLKFPPFAITSKPGKIYLHVKNDGKDNIELLGILSKVNKAYCLSDKDMTPLKFSQVEAELKVAIPKNLVQPRVTVIVLDILDEKAKVIDENIQQEPNGSIKLPVSKSEYEIRRIGYNYEEQVTHRWGENTKQGLIWTVNINKLGKYKAISEDNGNNHYQYELISGKDTLMLNASGKVGIMSKKNQKGVIVFNKIGIHKIKIYPKETIGMSSDYKFKGLELIPE